MESPVPTDAPAAGIACAMVLAAGLGTRMRPITDRLPKPLVTVGGRTLLDHALDRIAEAGIPRAVVNVHHLADLVEAHLAGRAGAPAVAISDERDRLLETGGGVRRALPLLGKGPFLVLNADSFWIEGRQANLRRLVEAFDPTTTDLLLLVASTATSLGYDGRGDFHLDPAGALARRGAGEAAPFLYAGVAVVSPDLVADEPEAPFSLNRTFDRAADRGRLKGLPLDGQWLHVGTPEAIAAAEARLAEIAAEGPGPTR